MGCGIYPNEEEFAKRLEEEAVFQIKRLRNHPSLALWAGDNECDQEMRGSKLDPNRNILTRSVLKKCVELHDYARPYLPSSPYISTPAFRGEGLMPEEHLWGPRDYFKGPYYKDTFCHFASETGYHGFPSVTSLKKFLQENWNTASANRWKTRLVSRPTVRRKLCSSPAARLACRSSAICARMCSTAPSWSAVPSRSFPLPRASPMLAGWMKKTMWQHLNL